MHMHIACYQTLDGNNVTQSEGFLLGPDPSSQASLPAASDGKLEGKPGNEARDLGSLLCWFVMHMHIACYQTLDGNNVT